jgi:hopene-associated glycosyltransferase HpnB
VTLRYPLQQVRRGASGYAAVSAPTDTPAQRPTLVGHNTPMILSLLALLVWIYLFFAHGRFWRSGPELPPAAAPREALPEVDIIVPARDEAESIAPVITSLLKQDYPGRFRVVLVDDDSTDGTAELAGTAPELQVIRGKRKPEGWSGKLWALSQGIEATRAPVVLLTDADIVHDPRHLASLVARLERPPIAMASEMVRLNCSSIAERALVPAFVYFFQMLYPFSKVNDPASRVAAAAGGTVLIRREALQRIGGIAAIKDALIDDVTLAKAIKAIGPIYLGHSGLARSIRPYPDFASIWRMISRTAFTQLRHSSLVLLGTLLGLTLVWLVPVWAILSARGWTFAFGVAAFLLAAVSYVPTLARYGRSPLWAFGLPLVALFYMAATVGSAFNYWLGRGASWKRRDYGARVQ